MAVSRALSSEDAGLNQSSLATAKTRLFKDVDLSFEVTTTGELYKKQDAAAVKQAIKTLLLTDRFEKPFRPSFGAGLYNMLFETVDSYAEDEMHDRIFDAVSRYEPRAQILTIEFTPDAQKNKIGVEIRFQIKNSQDVITFTTVVSRLR